jgi:CHAT domain-containing protein
MSATSVTTAQIREYLLDTLSDDEVREAIELLLITDPDFLDTVRQEEDELIDDYVGGGLHGSARELFESRFLTTNERRLRVQLTRALRARALAAKPQTPSLITKLLGWFAASSFRPFAVAAAALVIVSLVAWFAWSPGAYEDQTLASLNRAFRIERPLESRISGLQYAPKTDLRGAGSDTVDAISLNLAERLALDAAAENDGPAQLHAVARVHLAKGEFDQAIDLLERSAAASPANAQVLNDLGTARLEKAKGMDDTPGDRTQLLASALDNFENAIETDPGLPEPRFNRALTLAAMNLPLQEAKAWEAYLEFDSTSQWADEARQRLDILRTNSSYRRSRTSDELLQQFLTAYRQNDDELAYQLVSKNREMITSKLIPQKLAFSFSAAETGSAAASEYLDALKYVGKLELARTKDPFWLTLSDFYTNRGTAHHPALRNAHQKLMQAFDDSANNRYVRGLANAKAAYEVLTSIGNTAEASIAEYWVAYLTDRNGSRREAEAIFAPASERAASSGHHWLAAQHYAWRAQIAMAFNEKSKALRYSTDALDHAGRAADHYLLQKVSAHRGLIYRALGALDHALDACEGVRNSLSPEEHPTRQHYWALNVAGDVLIALKHTAAARAVQHEALDIARAGIEDRSFQLGALIQLGMIAALERDKRSAVRLLEDARNIVATFDPADRRRSDAWVDLTYANILRDLDHCEPALAFYKRAADYHSQGEFPADRFDTHRGRLICRINLNQTDEIDAETAATLQILDEYRVEIREESMRNSFFGRVQDLFDALIAYELSVGRPERAFDYSESSRARSLLDLMSAGADIDLDTDEVQLPEKFSEPQSLQEIQRALPSHVQLVQYSLHRTGLAVFIVGGDSFQTVAVPIEPEEIQTRLRRFITEISTPGAAHEDSARWLGKHLFTPLGPHLDTEKAVVIIPDKELAALPFAALIDPASGRRLIEDHELHYAPSSNVFISANSRLVGAGTGETLLAVGDPAFDRTKHPGYTRLPAAEREVQRISNNFESTQKLSNADASKERVLSAMASSEVFHFAGHYVYSSRNPMLSGMLLAGDDSLLTNAEIARRRFPRLRLVVLSACKTGSEQLIGGEGMMGAARTFLAGGIPVVIASHWPVDSEASAELMEQFYKARRAAAGTTPSQALRTAQLMMLTNPVERYRHPFFWAPFISIGALTTNHKEPI